MRVMIVVTHLLGTGHLARALTLGRAFVAAGHTVRVVSGGLPVPHFDTTGITLSQLPPVRSNGTDFTHLLDDAGKVATADYLTGRTQILLDTFHSDAPDVLITELFPFGRRILRDEFKSLLRAASQHARPPLVLSSVRDILAPPSKPAKAAYADEMVEAFYDGVLVHADADLITLDQSWPVSAMLAQRLHYTGFVAPAPPDKLGKGSSRPTILVSAGGGTVGDRIYETACHAARQIPDHDWHLLVSGPDTRRATFHSIAPANVLIEPPSPDFRALLAQATASVSMCGYNTALDVLQTGVPAVFVPFDDGGEVEQGLRAKALAQQDAISVVTQSELTPDTLLRAIHAVRAAPPRAPRSDGMDGALQTVNCVQALLEARP